MESRIKGWNIYICIFCNVVTLQSISIQLKNLTEYGVKIFIKDGSLHSSRPLVATIFQESGESIEVRGGQEETVTFRKIYGITVTRTILHEEDLNTNCTNYPTEKFKTYKECDDDFLIRSYPSSQEVGRVVIVVFFPLSIFSECFQVERAGGWDLLLGLSAAMSDYSYREQVISGMLPETDSLY